jgi:two-component system, chemotaxis family, response regulator Rcp1
MPPRKRTLPSPIQILLVEDNPGDVRLMREALKQADLPAKLHVVRDGEQALSYLRHEQSHETQLVLLDMNLPRKDGREVLCEMKQDTTLREIPVVMLSNSSRPEDAARAKELRASRYVTKPSDLSSLIEFGKTLECLSHDGGQVKPKPPVSSAKRRVRSASQRSA